MEVFMKYTNVFTLVLGLAISPVFAMEQGYIKPNASRTTPAKNAVAFTVSDIINEFNTPVTVINLKEANVNYIDDNMVMRPEYVRQIPAEIIQNCSVILSGTEEAHKLQK